MQRIIEGEKSLCEGKKVEEHERKELGEKEEEKKERQRKVGTGKKRGSCMGRECYEKKSTKPQEHSLVFSGFFKSDLFQNSCKH